MIMELQFKVGDKVRVKSYENLIKIIEPCNLFKGAYINKHYSYGGIIKEMFGYCGKTYIITNIDDHRISLKDIPFIWADWMLELVNMEKEINLVDILKNCPIGTIFYSPIFGNVALTNVIIDNSTETPIIVTTIDNKIKKFYINGKYDKNGECMLFPSTGERSWNNFIIPRWRAVNGNPYYSMNSEFCPIQIIEKYRDSDNRRYEIRNYFRTYVECLNFINKVTNIK